MRLYDVDHGCIFEAGHGGYWDKYMLTKEGKPRKKLSYGILKWITEQCGGIFYPSVSSIASGVDGFGAFGIGSRWATGITSEKAAELLTGWIKEDEFPEPVKMEGIIKAESTKRQQRARDKGSELHGVFHDVTTGKVKLDGLTDEKRAFYYTCCKALHNDLDIKKGSYKTEVQKICSGIAGTCDVLANVPVIEWKTVEKFRTPHNSEIAQVCMYAHINGKDVAFLVQVHQTTMEYKIYGPYTDNVLSSNVHIMTRLLSVHQTLMQMKLASVKTVTPTGF